MASKHCVIIPNAFHGKWMWAKFKPFLEAAGHVVATFLLEASGDYPRPIESVASADQYTIPLLDVLKNVPEGEKVILVGHSFRGISAAIAMDKYPEKVEVAVFLNALLPDTTHRPSYVIEKYMEVFDDWEDCELPSNQSEFRFPVLLFQGICEISRPIPQKDSPSDTWRIQWLGEHLTMISTIIAEDKVDMRGDFTWSFMDGFEWSSGYTEKFGLHFVDLEHNLTRIPKASDKSYAAALAK